MELGSMDLQTLSWFQEGLGSWRITPPLRSPPVPPDPPSSCHPCSPSLAVGTFSAPSWDSQALGDMPPSLTSSLSPFPKPGHLGNPLAARKPHSAQREDKEWDN